MVSIGKRMSGPMTVQVFAKYPHDGQVKTRLAAQTDSETAVRVHCELVERQLRELMLLPGLIRIELWCTEDADLDYYHSLFRRWPRLRYRRQSSGDLGQRLDSALAATMRHSGRVLQIGTDCPVLQRAQIIDAARFVGSESDALFIPAEDGGYVLAAYSAYRACMFDNIEWSTHKVLEQALAQLWNLGFVTQTLSALWDIDRLADLERYRRLQAVSTE